MPSKILEAAQNIMSDMAFDDATEGFSEAEKDAVDSVLQAEGFYPEGYVPVIDVYGLETKLASFV